MASIAEILLAKGNAAAAAGAQRGNLYGQLIQQIGAAPGQLFEAARQREQDQLKQQLVQQQIAASQQDVALGQQKLQVGQRALANQDLLDQAWNNPQVYNPDHTINRDGVQQMMVQSGAGHLVPTFLEAADKLDDSRAALQQRQQALAQSYKDTLGADARVLAQAHYDPGLFHLYVTDRAKVGVIPPALADRYLQADTPDAVQAITAQWQAAEKPEFKEVPAGGSLVNLKRPEAGAVFTAPEKDETVVVNGQLVNQKTGARIGAPVAPQATKGKQSESFLLDGKPVKGVFDPDTGAYTYNGADVTARVRPIPPASVTIHNAQQTPPNMPAWALDDSRPAGGEANVLDPTIRMTPNGLHQAALNYIANGQFPPTGRGADPIAIAQRAAIVSKVGAIAAASGLDEPALRAFYKANGQSLAQQQKMQDAVQGFMATADKNAALLQASLKKIPDTGSPLFNQPLRAFASKVGGNPDLAQFATYLQSVQNEYGRIISQPTLAGQLTDSARHEAEVLASPNATVPQLLASLQALQNEGTNRLVSVGEQIQRIQQRMQAGPTGAAPADGGGRGAGRVRVIGPNGQTGTVPTGTTLPAGWRTE